MKIVLTLILLAALAYIAVIREMPRNYSGTTIHLAGDSTLAVQTASKRPTTGWGEPFTLKLCEGVRLINHAKNGRSTKSFLSENLWSSLLKKLQSGDIVMIQFGHNDQKIHDPILFTPPWHEYMENLQRFVVDVRAQDAKPVLLTPIARRAFDSQGKLEYTHGEYPVATREVAKAMDVKLIDLNAMTRDMIDELGPEGSKALYAHLAPGINENYAQGQQDDTHLNSLGALRVATLVATELKKNVADLICH